MIDKKTRVFYVVDSVEDNEEIFDTLESAESYFISLDTENKPRLFIAMVRNAYREKDKDSVVGTSWNYEDYSDTFYVVKVLLPENY